MWTYSQGTGLLRDPTGAAISMSGYSGHGAGLNNPGMQEIPDVGPIPCGLWDIGPAQTVDHLGPLAMALTPRPETDSYGRSGFWLHGDNASENHSASCGCIVEAESVRSAVAVSVDRVLRVIP